MKTQMLLTQNTCAFLLYNWLKLVNVNFETAFHRPRTSLTFSCFGNVDTSVSFCLSLQRCCARYFATVLSESFSSSSMFCGHDLKIST